MESEASKNALLRRELAMRHQARDLVVDPSTGKVFAKRRVTVTINNTDLQIFQNIPNVLSLIFKSDPVSKGLRLAFTGVQEAYGHEYIVLRSYGKICTKRRAFLKEGRLIVKVESANGREKFRLVDVSVQRFNLSSPVERTRLLSYQLGATKLARPGDRITGYLDAPKQISAKWTYGNFEAIALEEVK